MLPKVMIDTASAPAPETLKSLAAKLDADALLVGYQSMAGGASATMTRLDLRKADGSTQRVILRQCGPANLAAEPDSARHEFLLLQALSRRGFAVPEALYHDQSCTLLPVPFLVISHLDGVPDYGPDDPVGAAVETASFLARLHRITADADDLAFLAKPEDGPLFLSVERDALPDTLRTAHGILEEAWPPENRNGARLLHGDLWPGNLLWQQGTLNAVVDWEDASFGDPLIDLAIARVDMSWSFGIEAVAAFTKHYQKEAGLDLAALPLWDLHATLRQAPHAGDYAQGWQELGRGDINKEIISACHLKLVERATVSLKSNESAQAH